MNMGSELHGEVISTTPATARAAFRRLPKWSWPFRIAEVHTITPRRLSKMTDTRRSNHYRQIAATVKDPRCASTGDVMELKRMSRENSGFIFIVVKTTAEDFDHIFYAAYISVCAKVNYLLIFTIFLP